MIGKFNIFLNFLYFLRIIETLNEGDIYEPFLEDFETKTNDPGEISFLRQYSNFEKNYERDQDIRKINSYKKKHRQNIFTRFSPCMIKM